MAADREKQIAQAEEVLGDSLDKVGFAKGLYFGRYLNGKLRYPDLTADEEVNRKVAELKRFCAEKIDPVKIDRDADIPPDVIRGLGQIGVLGACLPKQCGGLGYSQTSYCRMIEVLGGHCASTALFVNAHHSIGPRSIVLFGTAEQQRAYLPKLASGEWISAFALTEPEAGSDAGNVQSTATPTADGRGYRINGQKRWITNGGIAQVLTVMARTPSLDGGESKVTAFLVTPDMPGFEVVEKRMPKCGVRGTATARLAFHDMMVPKENVLGKIGKGLKIALTVLDFGRVTFGASCTGAARFCLERATAHARGRVQFGQSLSEFELVQDKLATMSAGAFAMESCAYQSAALIDSGSDDYMIETAMLKVFATDVLWRIINDTIQIFGGKAYFTDEPYERLMRDGRINTIGEGANDVLRVFVALAGMRDVGMEMKGVLEALMNPVGNLGKIGSFATRRLGALFASPEIQVRHIELEQDAAALARLVSALGTQVQRLIVKYREGLLERQFQLARIADAATEIYVSACVLSRLDRLLVRPQHDGRGGNAAHGHGAVPGHASEHDARDYSHEHGGAGERRHAENGHDADDGPDNHITRDLATGRFYLATAARRIRRNFHDLWDNDDEIAVAEAKRLWS